MFVLYGLHWMKPCKLSLLGYWLPRQCRSEEFDEGILELLINFMAKLAVFLLNQWMWSFASHGLLFGLAVLNTMAAICLQEFIERYVLRNGIPSRIHFVWKLVITPLIFL